MERGNEYAAWAAAVGLVRAYERAASIERAFASDIIDGDDLSAAILLDETPPVGGVPRVSLGLDEVTYALLTGYGYLHDAGNELVVPSPKAFDAEFTDRALPEIERVLAAIGEPYVENLRGLRDAAGPEPDALAIRGSVTSLVQEAWIEPRGHGAYAVTPDGKAKLERAIAMHGER